MTSILPEWAPNVHPLIIHFPIAVLFLAVAVDLGAVVVRKIQWLGYAATLTYLAGALSALVAFLTGRQAADTVDLPSQANTVLNHHADLAQWTLIFFGVLALGRAGLLLTRRVPSAIQSRFLFLLGVGGLTLLVKTAENGAQLVYRFGVGSGPLMNPPVRLHPWGRESCWTTEVRGTGSQEESVALFQRNLAGLKVVRQTFLSNPMMMTALSCS